MDRRADVNGARDIYFTIININNVASALACPSLHTTLQKIESAQKHRYLFQLEEFPLRQPSFSIAPDFLPKSLGTFILVNASKNSLEPSGLKFFVDRIASLTRSEMLDPVVVSPSIFTLPVLSHVITSGLAFKRFKSALPPLFLLRYFFILPTHGDVFCTAPNDPFDAVSME